MVQARQGNTVKVHYSGSLEDGTIFDSSESRDAIEFTLGDGQLIPGFEDAVVGMSVGESKTVTVSPDQAYGPHKRELIVEVDKSQFPPDVDPAVGQQLQIPLDDGKVIPVTVSGVTDSMVTLDANHPLAGKDLTFQIRLIEVA